MTKDEALKMALEALKQIDEAMPFPVAKLAQASIKEALAQPEQEPVAWISTGPARMIHWTADKPAYGDDWVPLYTTPPQRKPLTDEELEQLSNKWRIIYGGHVSDFAKDIEAKLKEKNRSGQE